MKIESEFTVDAPVQQAWDVILDLERVAPCLPGAALEEAAGDEYQGTMVVKLGPISAKYRGTVKVEEADEVNHRAVLRASGKDLRGQGTASATIDCTMNGENGATRVRVETDMQVTGRVAQFGRGIMQDVATKMLDQFATCVEQEIVGTGVEEEPEQPAAVPSAEDSSNGAAQPGPRPRKIPPRETQPLDLGSVSQEALLKRATPVAAGLAGLVLVVTLIQLLRRSSSRVGPSFRLAVKELEIRR
jgi:carbon monoxide dehydrogenase subunit G